MAILWPSGATDQIQPMEALRRALRYAVALAEAGAGLLALRVDGVGAPAGALSDDGRLITWGIGSDAAHRIT
ncbi:MAG: hypothetical protein ACRDID_12900, partial [Ktedonobacterales bacterium]